MRYIHKIIAFALVLASLLSCGSMTVLASLEPAAEFLETTLLTEEVITHESLPEVEETPVMEETPTEEAIVTEPDESPDEEVTVEETTMEETSVEENAPAAESLIEEVMPIEEEEAIPKGDSYHWAKPGNTDAEILGGGTMLSENGRFYYSNDGIWLEQNGSTYYITAQDGNNLNLVDGWLYFTVADRILRVPMDGGTVETVCTAEDAIINLYVMDWELRYLVGECLYSYDLRNDTVWEEGVPDGTLAFIPTVYGNIFLTGSHQDYSLVVNGLVMAYDIRLGYTEMDEWLVVVNSGGTWQIALEELFAGSYTPEIYSLYDNVADASLNSGMTEEEQLAQEAAYVLSKEYQAISDGADMAVAVDGLSYISSNPDIAYLASNLTSNQTNMVLRARQMAEVEWTALEFRYSWGGNDSSYVNNNSFGSRLIATDGTTTYGYFVAGKTYRGVPYSQAVFTGYVGWELSLDEFMDAVNDSTSKFYSGYSTYSRTAPYYGSDCSGFVSWAWDLPIRCTCSSLVERGYAKYIGKSISLIQVGDCFNNPNKHVVLITDIGYDTNGNVVSIETTEQTPAKMRVACWGEQIPGKYYDSVYSNLNSIYSYYFEGGYSIYRRYCPDRAVSFTESDAVDLDKGGHAAAPRINVTVNEAGNAKVVSLSHTNANATIYYTTDGTKPTTSSKVYTGPFEVREETTVKAMADCGEEYEGSHIVTYVVTVSKADVPFLCLVEGDMDIRTETTYVSSGTKVSLINEDMDTIHYTTDGTTPTVNSPVMPESGIAITKSTTVKAVASSDKDLNSDVVTIHIELGNFHTISASFTDGGIISPSGDTGVLDGTDYTFAINTDAYYQLVDVKVDSVSVGTPDSYTFENVSKDHTIEAIFEVDLPFTDVDNQWYTDSVHFVYSRGLFNGVTPTLFMPEDNMTRGMFITVLGRFARVGTDLEDWSGTLGITNGSYINVRSGTAANENTAIVDRTGLVGEHIHVLGKVEASNSLDGAVWYKVNYDGTVGYIREKSTNSSQKTLLYVYSANFTDLPDGEYYTGYAQWGNAMGVVQGFGDGTFGPNQFISRQDICVLMYRYLTEYMSYELSSTTTTFGDDSSIAGYAKAAVYAMKKIGVVNGYEDGNFYPNYYATRAEVATMFANLYHWING